MGGAKQCPPGLCAISHRGCGGGGCVRARVMAAGRRGAAPRPGAGRGSWTLGQWVVLAAVLCASPVATLKTPSYSAGTKANLHLEPQVTTQRGFDQCKWRALLGHCDFYSCLDRTLHCVGSKHNRSVAFRFCDMTRHHINTFTTQGRRWAQLTNACALKVVAATGHMRRDEWCSRVDGATKQALVECASVSGICQVLWTNREVLHRIFSAGSWLTVVEAAKECPRTLVNRFIFWAMARMHLYR